MKKKNLYVLNVTEHNVMDSTQINVSCAGVFTNLDAAAVALKDRVMSDTNEIGFTVSDSAFSGAINTIKFENGNLITGKYNSSLLCGDSKTEYNICIADYNE